jgi:hypothetical protein
VQTVRLGSQDKGQRLLGEKWGASNQNWDGDSCKSVLSLNAFFTQPFFTSGITHPHIILPRIILQFSE